MIPYSRENVNPEMGENAIDIFISNSEIFTRQCASGEPAIRQNWMPW